MEGGRKLKEKEEGSFQETREEHTTQDTDSVSTTPDKSYSVVDLDLRISGRVDKCSTHWNPFNALESLRVNGVDVLPL